MASTQRNNLTLTLPPSLHRFVKKQTTQGGYDTPAEFLRELIRDAQRRASENRLEQLLVEGLESGPGIEVTPAYERNLRRRVTLRVQTTRGKG